MKKLLFYTFLLIIILAFHSCAFDFSNVKAEYIISDSSNKYRLVKLDSSVGSFYFGAINLYEASIDELTEINTTLLHNGNNVAIKDEISAAQIGMSILDKVYNDWSQANTVVVCYNSNANVWIIHGQVTDRDVTPSQVGIITIKADTGEIINILFSDSDT